MLSTPRPSFSQYHPACLPLSMSISVASIWLDNSVLDALRRACLLTSHSASIWLPRLSVV